MPSKADVPAGVEMVDLGLSVKWANMNVGATSPEEYGLYFAWGDTQGYMSDTCDDCYMVWENYKYSSNGRWSGMSKYTCPDSLILGIWYENGNFVGDNKTTLDSEDDAAHVNWGGGWRMPTDAEWTELCTNCTWTMTTQNGVNGYLVSACNGNSIFLPAAGRFSGSSLRDANLSGCYWSSSLTMTCSHAANFVSFNLMYVYEHCGARSSGHSIRAVCP